MKFIILLIKYKNSACWPVNRRVLAWPIDLGQWLGPSHHHLRDDLEVKLGSVGQVNQLVPPF